MNVSQYLKNCRLAAGLTQKYVAKKFRWTSSQYVSNWERGLSSPPLRRLKKLCKLINADPKKLKTKLANNYKKKLDQII